MTTPLPDLDKLHAEATPGEWVTTSYEGTNNAGRHCYSVCHDVGRDRDDEHRCVATVTAESEDQARSLGEWIATIHNAWPTISARLKEHDESIAELKADRRALVHEIRRYASYMLQLTEEFAKDDIERYQRAMDRAHEMQRKSDDEARANPEEFEANVEQVAKATRELRR